LSVEKTTVAIFGWFAAIACEVVDTNEKDEPKGPSLTCVFATLPVELVDFWGQDRSKTFLGQQLVLNFLRINHVCDWHHR